MQIDILIENSQEPGSRGHYERTKEWKSRCRLRKKISNYQCEECEKPKKKLHVHHLTYDRYGQENWEDLKVLCVPCHTEYHKAYPHHNRHFAKTKIAEKPDMDNLPQDFF